MKTSGRGTETTSCGFFTDLACKSGGRIESLLSARASASFWTVRHQTKSHRRGVVNCEAEPSGNHRRVAGKGKARAFVRKGGRTPDDPRSGEGTIHTQHGWKVELELSPDQGR